MPSFAINQLEMWQKDTFNPQEIGQELGWAKQLGFNTMLVSSSFIMGKDSEACIKRIDQYQTISEKYGIRPMLVLFGDV